MYILWYFTTFFHKHKAFAIAEEHLGIPPKIAARDLARQRVPDTLAIMAYVSLYYEALKQEQPGINYYKASLFSKCRSTLWAKKA